MDIEQVFPIRQVLRPDGTLVGPEPALSPDQLKDVYRWMVYLRVLDQRCLTLSRNGRMGTFPPFSGQEAVQVGSAYFLQKGKDWLFPTYRDHGAMQVFGVPTHNILRYYMGDEAGNKVPEGVNVCPMSIPIATQLLHAVGAGWAAKLQGHDVVTVGYVGDGGTSPGDFHEALNFASVYNVPAILLVSNNGYAISTPNNRQFKAKTIAQRALGYDIPGERVDGQDVLAVLSVFGEAIERARSGGGPTLIEAVTFRFGPHTTPDDPKRYRSEGEIKAGSGLAEHPEWQQKDPIYRLRQYLVQKGLWNDAADEACWTEAREQVSEAVTHAESHPRPTVDDLFDYLYAEPTPELLRQKAMVKEHLRKQEEKTHG